FQSCITSSCTLPIVKVPPSTNTKPGAVACSLKPVLYWNPPSLSLIFHPVALDWFFDEEDLLQLNITKDSIRANIILILKMFFIFIQLSKLVFNLVTQYSN